MSRSFNQWIELAYLAGILDGEGSFLASKAGNGRRYPGIKVNMTDKDVVDRFLKFFGVGQVSLEHSSYRQKLGRKPQWSWRLSNSKEALIVMKAVLPFMGARRSGRIKQLLSGDYRTVKETIDSPTPNIV